MTDTGKPALYFAHANGIPTATYRSLLKSWQADFDVGFLPAIGVNPRYPINAGWQNSVDEIIDDLEQRFPNRPIFGVGHSFGAMLLLMAAYRKPHLFRRLLILDPPLMLGSAGVKLSFIQRFFPGYMVKAFPVIGMTLKRRDHWASREAAAQALRGNRLFRSFDARCFDDFIDGGLQDDAERGGVSLTIPKAVEAAVFRHVPTDWWWRPRRAPNVPVELLTATDSEFYRAGYPQNLSRIYRIAHHVVEGSHMFPLERPDEIAAWVTDFWRKREGASSDIN